MSEAPKASLGKRVAVWLSSSPRSIGFHEGLVLRFQENEAAIRDLTRRVRELELRQEV